MGGTLEKLIKVSLTDEEALENSNKYFLFESIQKKEENLTEKEKKKSKKYKGVRKFIDDSILLQFLFFMILINPFFKEICECKNL
jgi:hypothetical protein